MLKHRSSILACFITIFHFSVLSECRLIWPKSLFVNFGPPGTGSS